MQDDISSQVLRIIADQALMDPADLTPSQSLQSLGLDSLAMVEIIFGIEETFDVSVPFNANDPAATGFDLSTVGAVIEGVRALVAAK